MTLPAFDIIPFAGALPLRFGTPRPAVPSHFVIPAKPSSKGDDWFGSVRVAYYGTEEVVEIGFAPGDIVLSFLGERLWDSDGVEDPIPSFLEHDENPVEYYGFIVFPKIGVTCTGFHDDDSSQRAITVFRRGHWDRHLPMSERPNLERYLK